MAWSDDRAIRKGVTNATQSPARHIEREQRRTIVNLDKGRARNERVVHDLIDDERFVGRNDGRTIVDRSHVGLERSQRIAVGVVGLYSEQIRTAVIITERHLDAPGFHAGPGDRIFDPIDQDRAGLDGSFASDGEKIAVGGNRVAARELEGRSLFIADEGQNRGALARDEGLGVAKGRSRRDAVGEERAIFRIHRRFDIVGKHRSVGQFLEAAQINAAQRRIGKERGHVDIVRARGGIYVAIQVHSDTP